MDLSQIKKIYFIGIKGVAMSGLAVIFKQMGYQVSGSDVAEKFITDNVLTKNKIKVFKSFNVQNIRKINPDLVVIGTSFSNKNIELDYARKNNIRIVLESELRGYVSSLKETIAVCGVHGKTTTTSYLAYIFQSAGLQPSYLFGSSKAHGLAANGQWQKGKHFIVEGDEYVKSLKSKQAKFLDLKSKLTVITSLEWEHVDVYKNLKSIETTFAKLVSQTIKNKGKIIACSDWPSINKIIKGKKNIVTYGLKSSAQWQAYDIYYKKNQTEFKVKKNNKYYGQFKIRLAGQHNVLNALACIIIGDLSKISRSKMAKGLFGFKGCVRRMSIIKKKGISFIDDYAHHPTEIKTTLQAVRQKYPQQRIKCIFQPHMVSRTKYLLNDFARAFDDCDEVIFTDIFKSAREKIKGISSRDLSAQTKRYHANVKYSGSLQSTSRYLKKNLKKDDVAVIMGAGDVYKLINNF